MPGLSALRVLRENLAQWVLRVRLALPGLLVRKVLPVLPGLPARRDLSVKPDPLVPRVP